MSEYLSKTFDSNFWAEIEEWDLSSFNEVYTLHDSYLDDLLISPSDGILLSIDWDTVWNKGFPEGYDKLLIHIPVFYSNKLLNNNVGCQCILDCESSIISDDIRNRLFEDEDFDSFNNAKTDELQHPAINPETTLTKMNIISGDLEILHSKNLKIVVMNETGDFLPVKKTK